MNKKDRIKELEGKIEYSIIMLNKADPSDLEELKKLKEEE